MTRYTERTAFQLMNGLAAYARTAAHLLRKSITLHFVLIAERAI